MSRRFSAPISRRLGGHDLGDPLEVRGPFLGRFPTLYAGRKDKTGDGRDADRGQARHERHAKGLSEGRPWGITDRSTGALTTFASKSLRYE